MTLKSYVVLVRGLNAPPDNTDEYEGMFPFFSEVKGSPLEPFPSVGIREIENKRVIVAGKIYNYESTTVLSGLKVALVYQNGELVNDLCINADTVTEGYKNLPNLTSYGLKFGYTLNEYIDILNYNFCGMSNTALRSKCLKKISIPNSNKIKIFDWYFWTIILSKYKAFFTNDTTTKYFVNRKSETHLPTLKNKKIMLKILNIKKNHKQKIKKLIERKKIININVLKENKISQNKKYNFWWE